MKTEILEKMLAWPLFGAGMENLGVNDAPCTIDVPGIHEKELLVRIDAIGLCFSDVKLIKAGEKHPRVLSKDLNKKPVIPGHEAVMTVLKVGDGYADRFKPGQRFIIQADIFFKGLGVAYGYAIDGGFAQYSVIDERVIDGDEGCYLLPLADSIPCAIAAMIEPWTCVIASYLIEKRKTPLKGGRMLIAGEPGDGHVYEPGSLLKQNPPSEILFIGLAESNIAEIKKAFPVIPVNRLEEIPEGDAFDDIFICAVKNRKFAEKLAASGRKNATVSFIGSYPDENWAFDVGAIHYKGWFYQGTESSNLSGAYGRNVRSSLSKGGACWLVGGAGAMGQMHTQIAVESHDGPSRILVTDMDDSRIENVKNQLKKTIKTKKIEFKTLNPSHFASPGEFLSKVAEFAQSSGGFDDIVMLVPSVPVLNSCISYMKKDCLMNIFAGIPAGTEGLLNVVGIIRSGHRFIGASGSMTSHLKYTLELVETDRINPASSLAAVGGMMDLKKGIKAVEAAKFPGKTVIFPNIKNMPLTPLKDIGKLSPDFEKTLSPEGFYTMKTEKAIFKHFSGQ